MPRLLWVAFHSNDDDNVPQLFPPQIILFLIKNFHNIPRKKSAATQNTLKLIIQRNNHSECLTSVLHKLTIFHENLSFFSNKACSVLISFSILYTTTTRKSRSQLVLEGWASRALRPTCCSFPEKNPLNID